MVDDAKLIRVLAEKQERGEGSVFIRAALYAYVERPSRGEVLAAMRSLEDALARMERGLEERLEESVEGEAEQNLRNQVKQWRKT